MIHCNWNQNFHVCYLKKKVVLTKDNFSMGKLVWVLKSTCYARFLWPVV
jgi:hypothetical protein